MAKKANVTPDDVELANGYTIKNYKDNESNRETDEIAEFLYRRFKERYLDPISSKNDVKHGFSIVAVSCLMIETLESFYRGWPDSDRKSELAFCYFFQRNPEFHVFSQCCEDFYKRVRCGILHQGETTNGWRIHRMGPLLDPVRKIINAAKFHECMERALEAYRDELKKSQWDSPVWVNFRKKMKAIIDNCQ